MINESNDAQKNKQTLNFFSLNNIDESSLALRFRSHSCVIPSISDLYNCLDLVPKLRYLNIQKLILIY